MMQAPLAMQPPPASASGGAALNLDAGLGLAALMAQGMTLAAVRGWSPRRVEAFYALGHAAFKSGRYGEAQRIFAFVVLNDHLDRRYRMALGTVLQVQRQHEQALKSYGIASLLDLTDPEPVVRMAECLLSLGRGPHARQALEQARAQLGIKPELQALRRQVDVMLELMDTRAAATASGAPRAGD